MKPKSPCRIAAGGLFPFSEIDMNEDQRNFLTNRTKRLLQIKPELQLLHDKLLSIGGEFTVLPMVEEDLQKIVARGFKQYGWNATVKLGERSRCHANVAGLWDINREQIQIVTGYGLSKDGIWRRHSWCRDMQQPVRNRGLKDGLYRIVETTRKRKLYFGFILTDQEAEEFVHNNF